MADETRPKNPKLGLATLIRGCGPAHLMARIPYAKSFYVNVVERLVVEPKFPRFMKDQEKVDPSNLDSLLDFAMVEWGELIGPSQVRSEIKSLLSILQERKIKRFMEIGTANGGTLFLYCKIFGKGSAGISVDLPGGRFGYGYPGYKEKLYQSFVAEGQTLHLLREDSHAQSTLEKVEALLGGEKLDFLFIDGDHSYEGVKRDFEMYSGLVGKGGIIAFHDIAFHPPKVGCHVDLLWEEIKGKHEHKEFKDNPGGWCGIGVLFV